ncbi:GNAT family N-acetyltransferase [Urechidicola vernalis]|uniref:GNAT family N-acetyltransferase n=1 Tax=Urechidicola vernalis TaxID=3075600 RepID=A0ABU2Y1Y6_9FLAO|nr:GNAT family N-acetyltransferase [Urechidicola sp. P050]MDT0552202.1 GNAT family N-acetyltransferase [Urechidicola sp. P050]
MKQIKLMTFNQANKSDLNSIIRLLKNASIELEEKGIDQWKYWQNPPKEKIDWLKHGLLNNEFFFVTANESVIGMFRLLYEDELYWGKQNDKAGYIHSLVIDSKFNGRGYGNKIVTQVEQELIAKDILLLRLDCLASNKGLCSYYEKQGFKKIGEVQMPLSLNNLYEKKLN